MQKIGVVTDSHSSIPRGEAERLGVMVLPMPFYIEGTCYYEDEDLSREEFLERLKDLEDISTSQPAPEAVMRIWDTALEKYEEILYIPISSGLSGSCSTAMAMAEEDPYRGRVHVVDNGRISTPLHRSILDALELIGQGYSAARIKEILEKARARMGIYIAVQDLRYLKHGGRISATAAMAGSLLNIKPVLHFDVGMLEVHKKCRGFLKAKKAMLDAVRKDLEETYRREFESGEVYLLAASSAEPGETQKWVEEIQAAFPGMAVLCDNLSFGECCHIGPGGLGIGYSCRPLTEETPLSHAKTTMI